jgi:hypothetical protein
MSPTCRDAVVLAGRRLAAAAAADGGGGGGRWRRRRRQRRPFLSLAALGGGLMPCGVRVLVSRGVADLLLTGI